MQQRGAGEKTWSGRGWTVTITTLGMELTGETGSASIQSADASRIEVRRRWFRCHVHQDGQRLARLRGISRSDVQELQLALRRLAVAPAIHNALAWHDAVRGSLDGSLAAQRWVPTEVVDSFLATRPERGLTDRIRSRGIEEMVTVRERMAADFLDVDLTSLVAETNMRIMRMELATRRPFLDTIEKSPLTEEQARAVICFDNRVQVLAAAGSGKTSVMVARAAYAVDRGFVTADRILMLAFNKAAAAELQDRVSGRFAEAKIDATGLRASTFHSFGLEVIGAATGEKPRLASWVEQAQDAQAVMAIIDDLRDRSMTFRYRWDLYRLLFANAPTDLDQDEPDGWDKESSETGYRTFAGEVVKSHGERLIANFLYLNGVDYVYERPYEIDVADATHSQYRPDFYYPAIDVWHEHWGIDQDGNPPAEFEGYAETMTWKRELHATHDTTLVESTWAEVMFGTGLDDLRAELTELGLTFDWNPDRPIDDAWSKPMKHEDLARLVRTFMTHVKSNSWTASDLEGRLGGELKHLDGFRTSLFLDVYWPIHAEWERRLADDRSVDFEDMLVRAADHLDAGNVDVPYDLIMVDEFQDASQARARLVRGLVQRPGRFLLTVGDDWQSVNRFAGADLSVMTGFESWFGRGQQLSLTTTFRCPQIICDVAREFVSKNPGQFDKPMRSAHVDAGPPVTVIRAGDHAKAVATYLQDLATSIEKRRVAPGPDGTVSVDVLGRYRFHRDVLPSKIPSNLNVTFRTVHGSKGLEADYILIVGMDTGAYGFPSAIADDPVLGLAMPGAESFTHAEERRLLYVALTRARRGVTLIGTPDRLSPFVIELLADRRVEDGAADVAPVEICPTCKRGTLVRRKSKYGTFLGCSAFPACKHTRNAT